MNVYELYGEELRYRGKFLSVDSKWVYYVVRGGYIHQMAILYARVLDRIEPVIELVDGLP